MVVESLSSSQKWGLLFSPTNPKKFLRFGPEISFYDINETASDCDDKAKKVFLKNTDIINDLPTQRYVAWHPDSCQNESFIIGFNCGTVVYSSLHEQAVPAQVSIYPSNNETVNTCLDWNNTERGMVAGGTEKNNIESAVLLWDLHVQTSFYSNSKYLYLDERNAIEKITAPETTHFVAWQPNTSKILIYSQAGRYFNVCDIRDSNRALFCVPCWSSNRIKFHPHKSHTFVTYCDQIHSSLYCWDLRKLSAPVLTSFLSHPISQCCWTSFSSNHLSWLNRDGSGIKIWEITNLEGNGGSSVSTIPVYKNFNSVTNSILSSHTWPSFMPNNCMYITNQGEVGFINPFENCFPTWTPIDQIYIHHNYKETFSNDTEFHCQHIVDRSNHGYYRILDQKFKIFADSPEIYDENLQYFWNFFLNICDVKRNWSSENWGISQFLHSDQSNGSFLTDSEKNNFLRVCGWNVTIEDVESVDAFIKSIRNCEKFSKCIMICIFLGRTELMIEVLERELTIDNENFALISAIVSKCQNPLATSWDRLFERLKNSIKDPYWNLCLEFLSLKLSDDYMIILKACKITLMDKLAVASLVMPINEVKQLIDFEMKKCTEENNILLAVLLAENMSTGFMLLQRFLDQTGDIQTVALFTLHLEGNEIRKNQIFLGWIDSYRELLNKIQLWNERVWIDKRFPSLSVNFLNRFSQKTAFFCSGCGDKLGNTSSQSFVKTPHPKNLVCFHCSRPLPRCSVCLKHLDFSVDDYESGDSNEVVERNQDYHNLSWCLNCRHIGHPSHLRTWFSTSKTCPIPGCHCNCAAHLTL